MTPWETRSKKSVRARSSLQPLTQDYTESPVVIIASYCVRSARSLASMKANYQFQNLCGTVYRQGNVVFTPDGNSVLSPVGNRVSVFDLVKWVLAALSLLQLGIG